MIPTSGPVSFSNINTERGAAANAPIDLAWVSSNTYYNYKDLNSIRGYLYYTAVSSQNSISRTPSSTVTNCGGVYNCGELQCNTYGQCGYSHGTYLQAQCNCNCTYYVKYNCNCDCYCMVCFPRGAMVLMADGAWKEISTVTVGELLWSPHGPVACYEAHVTALGSRPLLAMDDFSLLWSGEHPLWVKRGERESFWAVCRDLALYEVAAGIVPLMEADLILAGRVGVPEHFAALDGWRRRTPVEVGASQDLSGLPLYLPFTGSIICVNGYLVSGAADATKYDFRNFRWRPEHGGV